MRRLLAAALLLVNAAAFADDAPQKTPDDYVYDRPGPLTFIKNIPSDFRDYGRETFRRENIPIMIGITAATGLLIWQDQYLVDKSRNLGDHLGISHTQYQKTFASFTFPGTKKSVGIEGPFDSGSALYFIGDGWTDTIIAGSFLTYGLAADNDRAIDTASEMAESVLTSGIVVQTLKHVTGRESPFTTNTPRGNWRFFPNQIAYAHNVPKYDAFPSGHFAAATAVLTVISSNYDEYHWIRPLGWTLIGVLGFQMMNNGVHWPSDYPLAIALGYGFGKIAVRKGRHHAGKKEASLHFLPMVAPDTLGVQVVSRFGKGGKR
ncbi:MAG: phosphatase PAP2 family protein [Elusimicrobia bacterium]|nr:phosphatase PAP2 family protein [Elusimicrobiota bacterium]